MSLSKPNRSTATGTRTRAGDDVMPTSGMCVVCVQGCTGLCEVGMSAYRGAEVIYPRPFGVVTAAGDKDYPVDFSHLSIMGTAFGAHGVPPDPDEAVFPAVNLETAIGRDKGIKLKLPIVIPALGSTDIAKNNWAGIAIGAAISGIALTIGENICGMDSNAEFKNGRVVRSPDMEMRIKLYRDWQEDGYGDIIVQANVEDTLSGVHEYVIEELGVTSVELKWGQGAKDIGGEVKVSELERALQLVDRGYIVLPDPRDKGIVQAFKSGAFKEFERHSRLGMPDRESFLNRVEQLRRLGAKYVFLKTGAYRPADLAKAIKWSSEAGVDVITIDGAGGGTGMSPWRMMCEWGIPTVYLASLAYQYAKRLSEKGEYVPDILIAGGISLEDHIFKAIALGSPYFKGVAMARAPLCAVMVGNTIGELIRKGELPKSIRDNYGNTIEQIFISAMQLKERFGDRFEHIPTGAIGLFTYLQRIAQGLRQLMAGARKFSLEYLTRDDLAALTREAAEVTGLSYVMELDAEEVERILDSG
ncbi:MAG: FMN-binding glutamate synthase family protein [Armatimonadota bacterium]|nr:FMN-binding glutamate synthase family protein [Armatimonadota bacterium]MCX7776724.1 FMN-binding glutamate synthase family protein [Armatimonadota bacterium]MDW8025793.1 FMN-binding glutamate synthase family protein [Armatimonadota bacterium]